MYDCDAGDFVNFLKGFAAMEAGRLINGMLVAQKE
jgi:hypothetical protein